MRATTIFKVFRNSSLVTSQGELKISRVFSSGQAAGKARYFYYRTENGVEIFSRRTGTGNCKFAVVGR